MSEGVYTTLEALTRLQHQAQLLRPRPATDLRSVLSGRQRGRLRGRGLEFDEIRHYQRGDDVRHIDWRITQRRRQPFVRTYQEERDRPVWVVIDQGVKMFFGSQTNMKSVTAAEIGALASWQALAHSDRIGAVLFSDTEQHLSAPSRAPDKTLRWMTELVAMNGKLSARGRVGDGRGLERALATLTQLSPREALIWIISDFSDWNPECLSSFETLQRRNDLVAAWVSDPLEHNLVADNKAIISDGMHQLRVSTLTQAQLSRFHSGFADSLQTMKSALARHHIPLLTFDTARATPEQWVTAAAQTGFKQ
jgi:uncharacterized protein (DUF58 family)